MANNHPDDVSVESAAASNGEPHSQRQGRVDAEFEKEGFTRGRSLILASVARDARLDQKFILLIILAAAIATLGLLQDSPAVVIGAMLVSPLLGPIMGIGFGLATLESSLIKRSLVTLAAGMAVAILVAVLIVWLSPIQDVTQELRARTQPTLLDLGVAVVGGIAGVYAIMRKLSGVMVGVAIATALVPPLSTVGFGLATGRMDFALGAALLFLTNTLAIAFAATIVARFNKFGPSLTPQHTAVQLVTIVSTLGILSIPLALSLNSIAREIRARSTVQIELERLIGDAGRVDTLNVRLEGEVVAIDGVVLIDHYKPRLNVELSEAVRKELQRNARVSMAQLKQQSNSDEQLEERISRRVAALEQRSEEERRVLIGLMVGNLIQREHIFIDAQARRVIIQRDRNAEGDRVAKAIDNIVVQVQGTYPLWLIEAVPPPRVNR